MVQSLAADHLEALKPRRHMWGATKRVVVPLASGSIGQVHLATLKADRDSFPAGLPVAVKVQHPNLAANLALDMAILRGAAELVGSFH